MTKTDERIDDLRQVVSKIDDRLMLVECTMSKTREEAIVRQGDLKDLIVEAVKQGNEVIFKEINTLKIDVDNLKNAEGRRAIENRRETLKTIRSVLITVIVTFFGTLMLNNAVSIIAYNTTKNNEVVVEND